MRDAGFRCLTPSDLDVTVDEYEATHRGVWSMLNNESLPEVVRVTLHVSVLTWGAPLASDDEKREAFGHLVALTGEWTERGSHI